MDFFCVLAALFIFVGNLLNAIWFGLEKRSRDSFDWNQYLDLDKDYLQEHWESRRDLTGLHLAGSFITAISWVLLTIPIMQAAWILSSGGKRMLWLHTMMVALAVAASTTEFVARLMHVGSWNAANWIAKDFEMEDWGFNNGIGYKSIEVTYQITQGMVLWVDGFEYFALFGVLVLNFLSIRTASSGILGMEMCWAGTGFFIGCLSLVDFIFLVLRFKNWNTYNLVAIIMTVMIRLILLPCWILLLAFKLPPAVEEFSESKRQSNNAAITTPLTTPTGPSPNVFSIDEHYD